MFNRLHSSSKFIKNNNSYRFSIPKNLKTIPRFSTINLGFLLPRSFSLSKFSFDQQKKGPRLEPKPETQKKVSVATATQDSKTTAATSIVDTNTRTVVRGAETEEQIKSSVSKLLETEVENLKDNFMSVDVQADIAKQFLAKSKYEVTEGKDGEVIMKRSQGNQQITVTFNRSEIAEPDEEDVEEAEQAEQGEEKSNSEDNSNLTKQSLQVEISFKEKKEKWVLSAFSGKDNRLYVEDMSVTPIDIPASETSALEALPFESLSDDVQDRIYDLLDEFSVDDQLAHFVKWYTMSSEAKSAIKLLENLKDLLK